MRWRKILIWTFGFIATLVVTAYLSVEVLLQSSYKNLALGEYTEAAANSSRAVLIAGLFYPASSKHYQNMFLYDVKVWSQLGTMGMSFGPGLKNFTVLKMMSFEKLNEKELTREQMARIQIEAARIDNATTQGRGFPMVSRLIDKSQTSHDIWSAYASEEQAYAELTGILAVRSPKNSEEQQRNDWEIDLAGKEHNAAQELICKSDVVNCRFNNLRWQIGICIRRAFGSQTNNCSPETIREVTTYSGGICKGLTLDQCYSMMSNLLPYYHNLLQAEGTLSSREDEAIKPTSVITR
jgi:hypothetical protein